MFLGVLESREVGATFAFGFMKKYLFSKKLEHKTFCVSFFIDRFWGNKKFQKISFFFGFQKVENFKKVRNFSKVENFSISKKNIFRKIMFSETLRYILSEKIIFRKTIFFEIKKIPTFEKFRTFLKISTF